MSTTYQPTDSDYIIDVANLGNHPNNTNGFHVITPNTQVTGNATYTANTTPDGELLTISIEATSRACFKGGFDEFTPSSTVTASEVVLAAVAASGLIGNPLAPIAALILAFGASAIATFEAADTSGAYLGAQNPINQQVSSSNVELQVFLRSREKIKDTGKIEQTFFITTRGLCCCGDQEMPTLQDGIVYFHEIQNVKWRDRNQTQSSMRPTPSPVGATDGSATMGVPYDGMMTIDDANSLQAVLREEMLQSLVSPRRTEPRSIAQTEMLTNAILPYIQQNPLYRVLLRQSAPDVIPEQLAE